MTERQTTTSRRQKAEEREQQILDVALALFARQGFAATSTRQIAAEVGVTEGLIFHYFPTKAALLQSIASQRTMFVGEVQSLLERARGQPARDVLQGIVLGWVDAIHHQGDLVTMLLVESQSNDELNEALRTVIGATAGRLAQYLQSRVEAGELRADLPVSTSALMFFSSLMLFFLTHRQLPAAEWRERATAFTQQMLDIWLRGALPGDSEIPDPETWG